jgi:hypothetical protein
MHLYHFASFYALENVGPENILAVGLKAEPCRDWSVPITGGMACVWLTDNSDLPEAYCSYHEVRIQVSIPSHDRRLVHFPKLARRRLSAEQQACLPSEVRSFYVYLGDVPLHHLKAVEYAEVERRKEMLKEAETQLE